MTEALILDYVRTPRGKASRKGSLHGRTPLELVTHLQEALVARTGIDPATIEDVVLGCAGQVDEQGGNIARTATLLAGWGDKVPGVTLNRFCASGVDAVGHASARVRAGDLSLAVAGGVESVSRVPMFADRGPLWSDPETVRRIGSVHMGIAADLNATLLGYTRQQLDEYGLETQQKAAAAWERGAFRRSVVPLARSGSALGLDHDELVQPDTTMQFLAGLEPAFAQMGAEGQDAIALGMYPKADRITHLHTVGTSPAMADGAALLLIGDAHAAERAGLAPRGRVLAAATSSVNPVVMLTAGQSAVEKLIERARLRPADIDVFEFAEAFSALCLKFRNDLDTGPDRMNPNGGTMAMGHTFGATGAILVGSCLEELERRDARYGIAAVSGAAGLGVAVLVEKLDA
ncbi:acetyl-CoA C-acyltransferase [Sciscionella marina]|uniref:acetyl-CoA C-acyltransferase n=1 Tax=Sciscionella marina TaxID=508770 RepID=UPI00036C9D13|nr:acetyl-CoA C-acyltransferase [Sciscionella marina]